MAQDYNVEDILEEIRRKKSRGERSGAFTDTYQEPRSPRDGFDTPGWQEADSGDIYGTSAHERRSRETAAPRPGRRNPADASQQAGREAGKWDSQPSGSMTGRGRPSRIPGMGNAQGMGRAGRPSGRRQPEEEFGGFKLPEEDAYQGRPAKRRQPEEDFGGFGWDSGSEAVMEPAPEPADSWEAGWPDMPAQDAGQETMGFSSDAFFDDGCNPCSDFQVRTPSGAAEGPGRRGRSEPEPQPAAIQRRRQEERRLSRLPSWGEGYGEEEEIGQEDEDDEDDFSSMQDAPYVAKDIKNIRMGLNVKLILTGALLMISLYLAMSLRVLPFGELLGLPEDYLLPLPTILWPDQHMRIFLIANLVICILAAIVCGNIVGGGISSLVRFKADTDSPAALAIFGVLVQGIVLLIFPDAVYATEHINLYIPVAIAALFFNLVGKKMLMGRVWRNFRYLTGQNEKYTLTYIKNRDLGREFAKGLGPDVDQVAYSVKTDFLKGFLDSSYSSGYSEMLCRLAVPITFLGAVVVGVVTGILSKDAAISVSAFSAVLCVVAPFSSAIVPNLMLGRASKRLPREGGMIAGYDAAEEICGTRAVVINDRDLFTDDSIMLHGMKVFAEKRVDEAILDAASVIVSCGGLMSGAFLNMVGNDRRLLRPVDSVAYEEGMGISAWVNGKRVLIGNRDLIEGHEIACPSRDFENRYARDGRRILYVANSGELSAMFVISYNASPDIADLLQEMERRGISLIVHTTDPNIGCELLSLEFGIKRSHVRVLPGELQEEYRSLTKEKARVVSGNAHPGTLDGICMLLRVAASVKRSVSIASIVQLVGVVVGYGLVAMMAFANSLVAASHNTLLLYGIAWMLVSTVAAAAAKR